MSNEAKPWYRSKTVIFNALSFAVAIAEYAAGRPFSSANPGLSELFALVVTAGNLLLRMMTTGPIKKG